MVAIFVLPLCLLDVPSTWAKALADKTRTTIPRTFCILYL